MSNKSSDFWYYSRGERQATIILFGVIVVLCLSPAIYRFLPEQPTTLNTAIFEEAIQEWEDSTTRQAVAELFYFDPNTVGGDELLALGLSPTTVSTLLNYRKKGGHFKQVEDLARIYGMAPEDLARLRPFVRINTLTGNNFEKTAKVKPPTTEFFPFDPNTVEKMDLVRLGLPERVIRNLLNYRAKGGRFRQAEDLKKIYGLEVEDYRRLQDYIQIRETAVSPPIETVAVQLSTTEESQRILPKSYESRPRVIVDINLATTEEWQQLYGLGPVLSNRIVKFREKLGGFTHIDQVAQTFGLPDSTFQAIRPQLHFSPALQLIPINTADEERLKEHPYIKWQEARVIVAYRKEHGPFNRLEDLRKVRALSEEFIAKIGPYLQFSSSENY